MISFANKQFPPATIIMALRWHVYNKLSYREIEELLNRRGINVDHATVQRWISEFCPKFEGSFFEASPLKTSPWRMEHKEIKVKGKNVFLYEAIDKNGVLIDFLITNRIDESMTRQFFQDSMHLADKEPPIAPKEVNRRERKKQMVRNSLLEASYQLFVSKGFDETRIEDITDIVDISSRTFFRYFSCKEDLVLDYYEVEQKEILVALASRPMSESIYTAIRKAAVEVTKGCEEGSYGIDPKRFTTIRSLIRKHPMVCARKLSRSDSYNQALSDLIAARMEVSMLKDIRPRVLAASIEFAYSTSYDLWKSESQNNKSYYEVLNDVFLFLENNES